MSDSSRIRILTVDDHQLIRTGIATLLLAEQDMELVAEAANGREAIARFREHHPDITLMDLQMPELDGLDAILAIRSEFPQARIIVLTTYAGDVQAQRALKAGAQGYLLKNSLHKELLQTIRSVHAGRKAMSAELTAQVLAHSGEELLTQREIDVLRLIAEGNANKEIAARLSITEETVKSRVKNILDKLGANDRTHAVTIALKRGFIEL
ncbi:MAG: response regulator transcription factor [Bryobacteraceae bacterium]|nr:response regulator transcription factor [Bryobacteraceae bacterium]